MRTSILAAALVAVIVVAASFCLLKWEYRNHVPRFTQSLPIAVDLPEEWSNISKHAEQPTNLEGYIKNDTLYLGFSRPHDAHMGIILDEGDNSDDYQYLRYLIYH